MYCQQCMTWSTVSFCCNIFITKQNCLHRLQKYRIVYGCWMKINHKFSTQLKSKSESITRQRNLQTLSTKKKIFLHFLKTGAELKKSLTLPSVFNRLVAWNDWKWSDQLQSSTYAIWYFVIKMLIMAKGGRSIQEFLFNINQKPLSI